MIEFVQTYPGGYRVVKRGLDASPMMIRQHGIQEGGVAVISTQHAEEIAMTVFHFHPSVCQSARRERMATDYKGFELLTGRRKSWVELLGLARLREMVQGLIGRKVAG